MRLIGQYDSPFVRRVAITMTLYGIEFEHAPLSAFGDFAALLESNPLGKVPALALDDGELLFDSQMILDHLDELAGPERALMPPLGPRRRAVLRRSAVALGLADKAIALRNELYRRADGSRDADTVERLTTQVGSALAWLEAAAPAPWFGETFAADDLITSVAVTFLKRKPPAHFAEARYPALEAQNRAAEALPAFAAHPFPDTGAAPA
ncbi:glutathione S-transferase family protein [Oceanibacterium hippocampi]|uniref:Putative GST-like protein YibF n=1 Tax=Oceanibacterium hippocampi TaxID=745714 RepID=A0A1Y5SVW7_9PROT|nr:glutathione S-transferase family protein [Oceanibacterium hippocampi]SLN49840.1 putative GST-like protein YibF [Oceanibacterium hippocampi]